MERDKQCEQINNFSSVRHLSRVRGRNLGLGFFCYLSCISLTRHCSSMALPPSTANWHWKNKNVTRWGTEWFEQELPTVTVAGDKEGEVVGISSVTNVDGDIELGQRKSKYVAWSFYSHPFLFFMTPVLFCIFSSDLDKLQCYFGLGLLMLICPCGRFLSG